MDNLEKIYTEVAEEMGLSRAMVRSVAEAQFSFVNKTIREKKFDSIRLKFFGIFKVKPGRLKYLGDKAKETIKQKTHEFDHLL